VIVDQFIVSAEDKWERLSALVMLLPHGFEGQGPEHSSARLERFLAMAAEYNIQIVVPSTPAQYFHLLRRQTLRHWKKPLIVMSPKSLLRLPACTSELDELASGRFFRVIDDKTIDRPEEVSRILLTSGKCYFDLADHRQEEELTNVAIVRMEELYPLPLDELEEVLGRYPEETPVVWVQEEPENMGAWRFLLAHVGQRLFDRHPLSLVARAASASPATGSHHSHRLEQQALMNQAFSG